VKSPPDRAARPLDLAALEPRARRFPAGDPNGSPKASPPIFPLIWKRAPTGARWRKPARSRRRRHRRVVQAVRGPPQEAVPRRYGFNHDRQECIDELAITPG